MIYFTGDTHFNHTNIIKYCGRPFADTEDMNEFMIKQWNNIVKPADDVYHVGDFGFGPLEKLTGILRRLNGKKHLCLGSHDKQIWALQEHFVEIKQILEVENFILCHYAMRVWPRSHYNSWHLYGHSHGKLEGQGKSFDVGVDCWCYTPLSLERVVAEMQKRPDNFNLVK